VAHEKVALFLAAVSGVVLHELGHALSALAFGDDTAKRAGRITLNPLKVNAFGAVILPGLLVAAGGYPMAFASTPVNPRKMRNPRLHSMLCSLAGPAVNLTLLLVSTVVLRNAPVSDLLTSPEHWPVLYLAAFAVGELNLILTVFNLIPIPPLDGSAVVERLLPRQWWPAWVKFRQYAMGILVLLLFAGVFNAVLTPCLNWWARTAHLPLRY
jgi:Zn-dependent protease